MSSASLIVARRVAALVLIAAAIHSPSMRVDAANYTRRLAATPSRHYMELPAFSFGGGERGVTEVSVLDGPSDGVVFVLERVQTIATQRIYANEDARERLCASAPTDAVWRRDHHSVRSPVLSRQQAPTTTATAVASPSTATLEVVGASGYYALTVFRCSGRADNAQAPTVNVRQYSVKGVAWDGAPSVSFAPYGDEYVPELHLAMFLLYSATCLVWLRQLRLAAARVAAIHAVMSAVLISMSLSLQLQWVTLDHYKRQGSSDSWLSQLSAVVTAVTAMLVFPCIVLLGSGWSVVTPTLRIRDRRLLVAVVLLQAVVHAKPWLPLADATSHYAIALLDLTSCCLALLPVVTTIGSLRPQAELPDGSSNPHQGTEEADEGAALMDVDDEVRRARKRLCQFRILYVACVAWVYTTRLVVPLVESQLSYATTWIAPAITLTSTWIYFVCVGATFRPLELDDDAPLSNSCEKSIDIACVAP